ncbi:NAD-dependent epimerase/dehydratase family protein [Paenibacillus sp. LMG 31460]|uniref:NAD-dependent epimerase/dehydratase family protein n=1 Tax=Paenibacillus germinis TaxID=2654979 RepID=A0ABX1Z2Q0_9BACL|nr:NAD(P)-dependent oxidoreductase [Paenibacillus germinis]NOU87498.1 NAD-dependent epimerase/dehydratase family protein [Paenibacillus germinis]
MNVFLTGATGKIGSRFVPRLLQHGHNVKAMIRDVSKSSTFQQLGIEVIEGDLLQKESLATALQGTDVVVHLAAQFRGVDEAVAKLSNIDASIALASAALDAEVPRFVFASTNLVYGSGAGAPNRPSREEDELRPGFPYPQTKVAAEEALLRLHREKGLGLHILRFGFVYGEHDPHVTEFLPIMSKWNLAKRLHMVHHADVSQALLLASCMHGINGHIYNVADDSPITVEELFRLHGLTDHHLTEAMQQEFNPWDMIVDTTRIREELNYRPIFPSFYSARDAGAL